MIDHCFYLYFYVFSFVFRNFLKILCCRFFCVFKIYIFLFTVLGFFDDRFIGVERGASYSVSVGILSGVTPDFFEFDIRLELITASK